MARSALTDIDGDTPKIDGRQPGEVQESQPLDTGQSSRFAALTVHMEDRKIFTGSSSTYPQEVVNFVESLYEAFQIDPDWWYPVTLDTPADIDAALDKARVYVRQRPAGRLVINCRREPDNPRMAWFRVSGYTPKRRS